MNESWAHPTAQDTAAPAQIAIGAQAGASERHDITEKSQAATVRAVVIGRYNIELT